MISSRLPRPANAGFTLLEMLIVLALLSMLMIVLTGIMFLGITSRGRVTAVALSQRDFSSFRRIMIFELGHAYPEWTTDGRHDFVDFEGSRDRISFLGPALDAQGAGLSHYQISVGGQAARSNILLQTTLSDGTQHSALTTQFATGLAGLNFKYFGLAKDGGPAIWQDDWTMRVIPPELIAIQVIFPMGDRRSWPVLMIHPEIEADISCSIDPETHRCVGR